MNKPIVIAALTMSLFGCFDSDNDSYEAPTPAPAPMNVAPEAVSVDLTTQTETQINDSLSATDADGDMLNFALETEADNGVVSIADNGDFTYTPNNEFTGSDSFSFTVDDGNGGTASGTVSITVEVLQVLFSELGRAAFSQASSDEPRRINGRDITNDVTDANAYDDLLID